MNLWWRVTVLMLPALLLDETLARLVALHGVRPDLALIGLLVTVLRFGPNVGAWTGFVAGLFLDVATPESLGARALSLSVSGFAVSKASEHVDARSLPVQLVLLGALGVLDGALREAAAHFLDPALGFRSFLRVHLLDLVYTVIVAAPLLAAAGRQLVPSRMAWRLVR